MSCVAANAQPSAFDPYFSCSVSGQVNVILVQPGGNITIGGDFTTVNGVTRGSVAKFDQVGALDPAFAPSSVSTPGVTCAALQGDGKVIIGGWFTNVNGVSRNRLARMNADGSLDMSFDPGTGTERVIHSIILQPEGKVLFCGEFTNYNGSARTGIAQVNSDGSLDTSFVPFLVGIGGSFPWLRCMARQVDGKILIGGNFDQINGMSRGNFARLHPDGTLDESFVVQPSSGNTVDAVAVQPDGKIVVATSGGIYRLDEQGASKILQIVNGSVFSIIVQPDGKIIMGGAFQNYFYDPNPFLFRNFVRLQPNGAIDTSLTLGTSANGDIRAMSLLDDGRLLVGGNFSTLKGATHIGVAELKGGPRSAPVFSTGASNIVTAAGQSIILVGQAWALPAPNYQWVFNGAALAGATNSGLRFVSVQANNTGDYTLVASNSVGVATSAVTRVTVNPPEPTFVAHPNSQTVLAGRAVTFSAFATGTPWPDYHWQFDGADLPGETSPVLTLGNPTLVHTGRYRAVASNALGVSISQDAILTVQPAPTLPGSVDVSFYPGAGADAAVWGAIELGDGGIMISGSFTNVGGAVRHKIARLRSDGGLDPNFVPRLGTYGTVSALAVQPDGRIICAGNGTSRLNSDGIVDTNYNSGGVPLTTFQYSMALQPDGRVVLGGANDGWGFMQRLLGNGAPDPAFNTSVGQPYGSTSGGCKCPYYTPVNAVLLQPDGAILLAGDFVEINHTNRSRIARVLLNGSLDGAFNGNAEADGAVNAIRLLPQGKFLVSGSFSRINGIARRRIARLNADGTLDPIFDAGTNFTGSVLTMAVQPDGKIIVGGTFTNIAGVTVGRIARLQPDGAFDHTFDTGSGANGTVRTVIFLRDGKILIGGDFTMFDGIPRNRVVRLNGDPNLLNPGFRNSKFEIAVQTDSGRTYTLESIGTLTNTWSYATTISGDGTIRILTDPGTNAAQKFYRVRVE